METPVRALRFIHHAIDAEARALAAAAAVDGPRLAFFRKVLHLHALGEEQGLFPAVAARAADVVPPYLLDHRVEERLLDEVAAGKPGAAAALAEHLALHIRKENELLVPLVDRLFAPPEQAELVGKMMSVFAPADMAEVLPWMLTHLPVDDRRAYVAVMERMLPADRFAGALGMLRAKLAPDVWASLGR